MRLSIGTKIFLGFIVVLLAFGGATLYGAWAVSTLGHKLRLVALGYSNLRLELQDQLTLQANLGRRLSEPQPGGRFRKELLADLKLRQLRLLGAQRRVSTMRTTLPEADSRFLDDVSARLSEVGALYKKSEPLLVRLHGDGGKDLLPEEAERLQRELRQIEGRATHLLEGLSTDLTDKVVGAVSTGELYAARVIWMTLFLSALSTLIALVVMLLVQATLRPLRRLSESAKEVAQGNYRQRVFADTPDEVGALGREFNAMAAALLEREQRLRRSEQLAAVGKMAAQITHEVRNPLSSIGLNAELLADEVAGAGSEAQALAKAIIREVDRLREITEQYLRFARLPEPRFEVGDVGAVLESLLKFMAEELAKGGIRLRRRIGEGLPEVLFDEGQLRTALLNLLRNACEAMAELPPDERLLEVSTEARSGAAGPLVRVEIRDHGPGIPEEHLARIFEPFFTTKKGGTGLGLALADEVVQKHGGRLRAERPEGGGTRFVIELPARVEGVEN